MPPKFHSARAYVAFDESIRKVETWVYARTPRFREFDARAFEFLNSLINAMLQNSDVMKRNFPVLRESVGIE